MTRWGLLAGVVMGIAELIFRGPTPGGLALYAVVLGADGALGAMTAWAIGRFGREGLRWLLPPIVLFLAGAQSDEARQGALAMPSPAKVGLIGARALSDVDRDGYGAWLGQGDCAPFDAAIHPAAAEIPGNGVDDNCLGGDLATALVASTERPAADRLARGVLLVTIDSLRADHVGAYGYDRPTTPNLDAVAARGALFERAYSHTPATRWSVPMIHTSQWPSEIAWDRTQSPHRLPAHSVTLAERLAALGVRTGASWPMSRSWGLEQGFGSWTQAKSGRRHHAAPVVGAARRFLSADDGGAWFFWVHLYDPHLPYEPRQRPFGDRPVDRYDAEILAADEALGGLLREVPDDTAVIVTSDHGEEFQDHGGYAHRDRLYEELIRVPLIVSIPQQTQRRTASSAGLIDLMPTVLHLLGAPRAGRGRSLVPDAMGQRDDQTRPVFASLAFYPDDPSQGRAALVGRRKLIFDPVTGRSESFNLAADPLERTPLPDDPAGLMPLLIPFIEQTSAP